MKKLVVANFKMNLTSSEIKKYVMALAPKFNSDKVDLSLALPFVSLESGKFLLSGSDISLTAQNISEEECGSLTGEVSGAMLKDIGVQRVIVGHSERRTRFKETGKSINKKIKIALKNRLQVVLCVGESLIDKNSMKSQAAITAQVDEALKGLYENELENIIIAYEPVWAIGTGKTASVKEIEEGIKVVRKAIETAFSKKAATEVRVLYGGSITAKNISQVVGVAGLDGVLVGGSCLDVATFIYIISVCEAGAKK